MDIWMRRTREKQQRLEEMEALLQATLQPLTPRPGFVRQLGDRLKESPLTVTERPQYFRIGTQVLAAIGVVGGLVLLLGNARKVISFFSGLAMQVARRQQPKSLGSPAM
jgi:hypothetical protein